MKYFKAKKFMKFYITMCGSSISATRPVAWLTRVSPRHTWLGYHFQGQKVKGQGHQAALVGCTSRPTWTCSNGDLSIFVHDVYRLSCQHLQAWNGAYRGGRPPTACQTWLCLQRGNICLPQLQAMLQHTALKKVLSKKYKAKYKAYMFGETIFDTITTELLAGVAVWQRELLA